MREERRKETKGEGREELRERQRHVYPMLLQAQCQPHSAAVPTDEHCTLSTCTGSAGPQRPTQY